MPARKNPLQIAMVLEKVHEAAQKAKDGVRNVAESAAKSVSEETGVEIETKYVDVVIKFIGASGLPKMDVVGSADPYFIAKIDHKISIVSTVQSNTLSPVWNETWKVRNVPTNANLQVEVLDKDNAPVDDYIGKFHTTISPGTKEVEIEGPLFKRTRGTFWLKIESSPSPNDAKSHSYIFDGPIRYSRHNSPTVGFLTNTHDTRLYSTWKIYLKGVPLFFSDRVQHWNCNYKAAQTIFQGPASIAVRTTIQAGHHMLYARSTSNVFGVISSADDVYNLLHGGTRTGGTGHDLFAHRVKPAVYTYIISAEDDSFRFSETGAAFFVDFASKHALHSNCAQTVRYSGEFHPRPEGGWEKFTDETPDHHVKWELVIDNSSGTYSPDPKVLPDLKALLEYNFPGFTIFALNYDDPELERSREACRAYALKHRGVQERELQPHAGEGEETLWLRVSARRT